MVLHVELSKERVCSTFGMPWRSAVFPETCSWRAAFSQSRTSSPHAETTSRGKQRCIRSGWTDVKNAKVQCTGTQLSCQLKGELSQHRDTYFVQSVLNC